MTKLIRLLTMLLTLGLFATAIITPVTAIAQQQLAEDDWARVQANGTIVFGTAADYAPFESYDSNFQLDGFDIMLAKALGEKLGLEVAFNDFAFDGLFDALQLGEVDAAIAAISVTPDRQQIVDFTNLYFVSDDAVLMRADDPIDLHAATDFAGKRVGVESGTIYQSWAQQNLVGAGVIAQEDLISYADTTTLVRDLRTGNIDVAILEQLVATLYSQRMDDLRVAGEGLSKQRYAIALRKGSTLTEHLNDALIELQIDGTYARLASQYLNISAGSLSNNTGTRVVENAPAQEVAAFRTTTCLYGMAFVADLNLDDQNMTAPPVMQPGQAFAKSWRVRNSGTCEWNENFALVYTHGNRPDAMMGAQPLLMGRTVVPGETIDLTVSLTAPPTFGVFQGFWQMRDDTGRLFGEVLWVGIQVPDPAPPTPVPATPTPAPPPGLNPNLRADATWISAGQCTTLRWNIDGVREVYLVDGNNVQGVGGHDARTVCPAQTFTYVLRVVQIDGRVVEFPIAINVTGQAPPPSRPGPSIRRFTADRNSVGSGQCVRFEWDTDNADGVNLYRSNNRIVSGGPRQGSQTDCPPDGHWDYRLEAFGNGNTSQTITVVASGRSRDE